jgi:hypothetical protein
MKCLNMYAVFGHAPTNRKGGKALEHFPIFSDDNGAQYLHRNGGFVLLSTVKTQRKDFIRIENAALGN